MAPGIMRRRRGPSRTGLALLVAGGVALIALAVIAFGSLVQGVNGASAPLSCSPKPCLNLQDYTLWVSNASEADGMVRMQAVFRNSSPSTHAAPEDLTLVDARHQSWPAVQDDAGCTKWSRTEFSNGAKLGPLTICFRPSSTTPPLTLHWSPDVNFLCCDADLKLE